jgi:Holliday junction resolvase-like predicted endonuclease
MNKSEFGKIGEDMACGYLVDKDYSIIDKNFGLKFGEIDIIALSPDKTLVFIEVKTMNSPAMAVHKSPASYPLIAGLKNISYSTENDYLIPEDQMTYSKISKFKKMCQFYANLHPELVGERGYELDVIAVSINNEACHLKHYKNI